MFKHEEGFSLIEVVLALVILTVAVFPILNYFTNSIGVVSQSVTLSQTADISVDIMEILKHGDIDTKTMTIDMSDSVPADPLASVIYNHVKGYDLFADYFIDIDISEIAKNGDNYGNIRKVSIKITWSDSEFELDSVVRIG
ncbi:type IV pilus modification PilV family protein [Halanaerobium hydrogeniformans]|uniref:Prepilin-type N-terminal cleavage/methylation domain-containing protein n=1 Tax=Halanaerobium hydrogeniformans TaxID=656519 RepID=E4RLF2_HALHG|nr:prepilin-type N-terminal cleavage/methylation domain-containing protein [Halanaerobium hydrogeniformans]ADQ14866.1 hypothetical protein Halsa_1439 [Halanaerobium hydrogeniformans]